MEEPLDDIAYEFEVMQRLLALGWPVPAVVEEPILFDGRMWCLLTYLPGASRVRGGGQVVCDRPQEIEAGPSANSSEERLARGRLLAQLHDSMAQLAGLGQRRGFSLSDEVVANPELIPSVREYESIYPVEGHVIRWHIDRAQKMFEEIDLEHAETIVLHGDFAPWNLLFEGERLTGMLDFEATHLNYRVADFANSWRGYQDEVIDGYQDVYKLSEVDWQLLIPVYWSWMFLGVKKEIKAMASRKAPPPDFEWQIRHLLRREGLFGERTEPYPGVKSGSH